VNRYSKYKESSVYWLGHVPSDWEIKKVKHAFRYLKVINRGMICEDRLALTMSGVIPRSLDDAEGLQTEDYSNYQIVEENNLLFKLIDLQNIKTSRVGLVPSRGIVSPAYIRLKSRSTIPVRYFYWYFMSIYVRDIFNTMGAGVRQSLNQSDLLELPLLFPTQEEMLKVSAYLDNVTSEIDSVIESQERMIELLKERIDSMVLTAISVQNLTQVRLGQVVEVISRPIEGNPSDSYVKLGLFNRGRGIFHKDESDNDDMGDSDFYYIRTGDLIISGQFAWEGAVAMAGESEDGCVVSHRYPVLRGIAGIAETEYILAFLCTEYGDFLLNEHSRGAAGRNRPLNIQSLLKEKIPLPSIQSQQKIVEAIKQRQVLLGVVARLNKILKERRSAIITQAVTGQIDVR